MNPTTLTQQTGSLPAGARRRGPVPAAFRHAPNHATRPYAGTPTICIAEPAGNWVLASGFWAGSMVASCTATKRPTRHLAPRST